MKPIQTIYLKQNGVSLLIVLIVLVVLSLIGIAGSQLVINSYKTTRYDRDYQIAFQAAELALSDAEMDILGKKVAGSTVSPRSSGIFEPGSKQAFVPGCGDNSSGTSIGLCTPSSPGAKPVWASVYETLDTKTVQFGTYTGQTFNSGVTGVLPVKSPRYVIEVLDDNAVATVNDATNTAKLTALYRITAYGFGPSQNSRAILQTEFRRTWN